MALNPSNSSDMEQLAVKGLNVAVFNDVVRYSRCNMIANALFIYANVHST